MSKHIKIRKGLNINLVGESEKITKDANQSSVYPLYMEDFHGITPKMMVKQGDEVLVGTNLFHSKATPEIKFASPVSGEITEIVRGAKRKILEIKILPDYEQKFDTTQQLDVANANAQSIKQYLCNHGLFPFIKQRPYDVIANPKHNPRDVFISATPTTPLAPDFDYTLKDYKQEIQAAIDALSKITQGKVYIGLGQNSTASVFNDLQNCDIHHFNLLHPAGNVSTQIANLSPINKGEIVWTIAPEDLVIIGKHLLSGEFHAKRTIALTGSEVNNPHYVRATIGAKINDILTDHLDYNANNRIISGNVFTGKTTNQDEGIRFYDNQITVIPEGDDYDFFGWNLPRPNKFSLLKANMFSFLTPNKQYKLNTSTNGEHRAFVLTGHYEKVFPLDIYPMHLLKSILYKDIDEMEKLGIYEVAPEDFALTEFICPSKMNQQEIIREGLDIMIKEVG